MRTEKLENVMDTIKGCLATGHFLDTFHSNTRMKTRLVTRSEVLYVLRNGHHEKKKDKYDDQYQEWNYSIRGKTLDKVDLRIIVSFDEFGMLIITVIKLG